MKDRPSTLNPRLPADIEAAAAAWLGLRDAGNMTPAQEAQFAAWLEADERHATAFAAIDRMWDSLDTLRSLQPAAADPDPDLLTRPGISAIRRPQTRQWKFVSTTLAAAAAIAMGCLVWWQAHSPALLESVAETRVGAQQTMSLPDGSSIQLNTDTGVEVRFGATERRVRLLRGEAHFVIAKERARPFVVNVGAVTVRAVGTAFNVRMATDAVEVLVTQGKVTVASPGPMGVPGGGVEPSERSDAAPRDLPERPLVAPDAGTSPLIAAGHRMVIPVPMPMASAPEMPPAVIPVAPAEIARALAWRAQRLEFEDASLAEVIAEFNRYNDHQIVIADARLMSERFGGKFRPDQPDALLRLLESSFGVQVERREHETVLRLSSDLAP